MKIGNVDVRLLKEKYDTPLYIYDVSKMKKNLRDYKNNFKSDLFETEIIYASKAFCIKEMLRLINKEGVSLDVVSMGELQTALAVGFPVNRIYFHGNNKSEQELILAVEEGIGTIVVDNLMELEVLERICFERKKTIHILIRLNLGIEAHTHKFIVTSHVDSKFGVSYNSIEYQKMKEIFLRSKYIIFDGFHSHIGSQIFDLSGYIAAMDKCIAISKDFDKPLVLNIGGGFGVRYTEADKPFSIIEGSKKLIEGCESALRKWKGKIKKLCIEPGRSIVAEAGNTLYTIGYLKQTPNKLYYFIDGGMTDNIRPALYQAKYNADIVGKENELKNHIVTIAGKCCESGDLIIEDIPLPMAVPNDLLITYTTGAYGYSMGSNYNKALFPAIVFIEDGEDRLVCKRQSYKELLEREI